MTENTTTYPISRSRTTQGSYLYPTLLANTIRRSPSMMYILLISTLLLDQPFSLYRRTIVAQSSHCNSCRSTIRDLGYRCRRDDSRFGREVESRLFVVHCSIIPKHEIMVLDSPELCNDRALVRIITLGLSNDNDHYP